MKNSWQILTLLLAVALVVLSFTTATLSNKLEATPVAVAVDTESVVLDAIMTRTSVRSYTSQPVESSKVETLLKAAMAAPTAGNRQPWQYVVITDRVILDAIPPVVKGAHMAAKAQLAIAVCGVPAESFPGAQAEYWVQDCSAATENMLLAAHSMGLGAVWCGVYPNDANDRTGKIAQLLSLPEGTIPLNIVVIGYPNAEPHVKDKWKPARVHYNSYTTK